MNCEEAKRHFVEWVYEELDTRHRAGLEQHLAACAACRDKLRALEQSRKLLELLGEKPVQIEAKAVLERVAGRAVRRSSRWRLAAVAAAGVAASLLAVLMSGVRVEWYRTHIVVAWGHGAHGAVVEPPHVERSTPSAPRRNGDDPWPALRQQGRRLAALDELVRVVVAELNSAERRQQRALGSLRTEFAELRAQNAVRWKLLDEDVRDLGATYLAAYRPAGAQSKAQESDKNEKGDQP